MSINKFFQLLFFVACALASGLSSCEVQQNLEAHFLCAPAYGTRDWQLQAYTSLMPGLYNQVDLTTHTGLALHRFTLETRYKEILHLLDVSKLENNRDGIVIVGSGEGATAALTSAARIKLPFLKALVIESPVDPLAQALIDYGQELYHKAQLSHDISQPLYAQALSNPTAWYASTPRAATQPLRDIYPISSASYIDRNLPILLVAEQHHGLYSKNTAHLLYIKLKQAGRTNIYLLDLEDTFTSDSLSESYVATVHAFYEKYNIPHDTLLAAQGRRHLEQAQPSIKSIEQSIIESYKDDAYNRTFMLGAYAALSGVSALLMPALNYAFGSQTVDDDPGEGPSDRSGKNKAPDRNPISPTVIVTGLSEESSPLLVIPRTTQQASILGSLFGMLFGTPTSTPLEEIGENTELMLQSVVQRVQDLNNEIEKTYAEKTATAAWVRTIRKQIAEIEEIVSGVIPSAMDLLVSEKGGEITLEHIEGLSCLQEKDREHLKEIMTTVRTISNKSKPWFEHVLKVASDQPERPQDDQEERIEVTGALAPSSAPERNQELEQLPYDDFVAMDRAIASRMADIEVAINDLKPINTEQLKRYEILNAKDLATLENKIKNEEVKHLIRELNSLNEKISTLQKRESDKVAAARGEQEVARLSLASEAEQTIENLLAIAKGGRDQLNTEVKGYKGTRKQFLNHVAQQGSQKHVEPALATITKYLETLKAHSGPSLNRAHELIPQMQEHASMGLIARQLQEAREKVDGIVTSIAQAKEALEQRQRNLLAAAKPNK